MDIIKGMMMIFFGFSLSTGYKFKLEVNETGRFIYKDHKNPNRDRYCSDCPEESRQFQTLIERDQESQCVAKLNKENDPAPEKSYFCKEHVGGLPGCGPLPESDHLKWMTKSGRNASKDSRVYEVYFPKCSQAYVPSMNTSQFRCGEQLIWSDNPTGIQCIPKGCGSLPVYKGITWLNKSGLPVENMNYSKVYEIYIPKCPPNHVVSRNITSFHCLESLQWNVQFGHLECVFESCGPLPKFKNITWLNKSGLEVKNTSYSEVNEIYTPKCPPNHVISKSITRFHCQDNLQWKNEFGHLDCISEETEMHYEWMILGIACSVIFILLLVPVVVLMKKHRYRSTRQDSLCPLGSRFLMSMSVHNEIREADDVTTVVTSSCDSSDVSHSSQNSRICSPKIPTEHQDIGQNSNFISESKDLFVTPSKGIENPDNPVWIDYPDNPVWIDYPDNAVWRDYPDNAVWRDYPDGTVCIKNEKNVNMETCHLCKLCNTENLENGKTTQELSANKTQELQDGTSKHDKELMMKIKVFPSSRDKTESEYPVFTVREGCDIWIATNQTVPPLCSLIVYRCDNHLYRGREEHPFLHGIDRVCASDSGVYYWYIKDETEVRQFQLKVKVVEEERWFPDGGEKEKDMNSGKQNHDTEQEDYLEHNGSAKSLECFAVPSSSYESDTEEKQLLERPPECSLSIDEVYEKEFYRPMLQQMCYCLDSIYKYDRNACWPSLAKYFLQRSEAYISSVEWHKRGDPENGPSSLILPQLRSIQHKKRLTIGHIASFFSDGIHHNEEFLRILKSFHRQCPYCEMIYER